MLCGMTYDTFLLIHCGVDEHVVVFDDIVGVAAYSNAQFTFTTQTHVDG